MNEHVALGLALFKSLDGKFVSIAVIFFQQRIEEKMIGDFIVKRIMDNILERNKICGLEYLNKYLLDLHSRIVPVLSNSCAVALFFAGFLFRRVLVSSEIAIFRYNKIG